jgi:hypothetical protein
MSRSAFERIPLSTGGQQAYMDRELQLMRTWLENAKNGDGDGLTVKRLHGALLRTANQPQAPPELRAALAAITRHVDDYANRAPFSRRVKLDTNVHKLTTKDR